MNNIEKAKAKIEEQQKEANVLENLINPPANQQKQKRIKLPLQRDVNLIESILNKKLETRGDQFKEIVLKRTEANFKGEIEAMHLKAIALRKEADAIAKRVDIATNGQVKMKYDSGNYYHSGYWDRLPEDMDKANEDEMMQADGNSFPEVAVLKAEIEEYILNFKIGLAPIADVKVLLEKIDNTLK